jgi:hypothetical protein
MKGLQLIQEERNGSVPLCQQQQLEKETFCPMMFPTNEESISFHTRLPTSKHSLKHAK